MIHERNITAPTAVDLEKIFGVQGMSAGRKIRPARWRALLAPDLPAREQALIGLQYAALGAAPPLLFGVLLALWICATTPANLW
jgi:hypothetical protein